MFRVALPPCLVRRFPPTVQACARESVSILQVLARGREVMMYIRVCVFQRPLWRSVVILAAVYKVSQNLTRTTNVVAVKLPLLFLLLLLLLLLLAPNFHILPRIPLVAAAAAVGRRFIFMEHPKVSGLLGELDRGCAGRLRGAFSCGR
jgi:hypothetical protein